MEIEVQIDFTDITIVEADGFFEEVNNIMNEEQRGQKEWMINTDATIISPFGIGEVELHLYYTGKVYIMRYIPSVGEVYYNPDIPAMASWALEHNWISVQPFADLARSEIDFWKHYYDTNILDCEYYDQLYGERE